MTLKKFRSLLTGCSRERNPDFGSAKSNICNRISAIAALVCGVRFQIENPIGQTLIYNEATHIEPRS